MNGIFSTDETIVDLAFVNIFNWLKKLFLLYIR